MTKRGRAVADVGPMHYRQGWDSYMARIGTGRYPEISANPYEFGSPKWVAWRDGFIAAESERLKDPPVSSASPRQRAKMGTEPDTGETR